MYKGICVRVYILGQLRRFYYAPWHGYWHKPCMTILKYMHTPLKTQSFCSCAVIKCLFVDTSKKDIINRAADYIISHGFCILLLGSIWCNIAQIAFCRTRKIASWSACGQTSCMTNHANKPTISSMHCSIAAVMHLLCICCSCSA